MLDSFFTTLIVLFASSTMACAMALPTSILWAKYRTASSRWTQWLSTSLLFIPLYVQVGGWSAGFGSLGWLTLSQVASAQNLQHGLLAVSLLHGVGSYSFASWILYLGMRRVPFELEQLAILEGGLPRLLRTVWGPRLLTWGAISWILCAAMISGEMLISNLFRIPTLTESCYLSISSGDENIWIWMASSLPAVVLSVAIAATFWWTRHPSSSHAASERSRDRSIELSSVTFRRCLTATVVAFTLMTSLLPIFNLLVKAGWDPRATDEGVRRSWSILQLGYALGKLPEYREEFYWTSLLTAGTLLLGLMITLLGVDFFSKTRTRLLGVILFLVFIRALPGPLLGLAIKRTLEALPGELSDFVVERTLIGPILAIQCRSLPFFLIPMMFVWRRWRSTYSDLITIDRLSRWRELFLFASANLRVIAAISLLTSAICISELSSILLLLPAGVSPISVRIFELLHYGVRYEEASLCLALGFLGIVMSIAAQWMSDPYLRKDL